MNDNNLIQTLINGVDENRPLLTILDTESLLELKYDPDHNIRSWVAKGLAFDAPNMLACQILCCLAQDEDPCVRTEAVDSLSAYHSHESFEALSRAIHDLDPFVRKYAAYSLADVGININSKGAQGVLQSVECEEANLHVLAALFRGMYLLGNTEYLDRLVELFDTSDYQIQLTVLNSLDELFDLQSAPRIKCFVDGLIDAAYARSVSISIDRLRARCVAK